PFLRQSRLFVSHPWHSHPCLLVNPPPSLLPSISTCRRHFRKSNSMNQPSSAEILVEYTDNELWGMFMHDYRVCQRGARPGVAHSFQRSAPTTFEALELYTNQIYTQFFGVSIRGSQWSFCIVYLLLISLGELNISIPARMSRGSSTHLHERYLCLQRLIYFPLISRALNSNPLLFAVVFGGVFL
ncbi:hypothetical protein P154DRAFT_599800, partial [Amniculicola lignicola CBS 123094]